MNSSPMIFSVVGYKNVGKTTLIAKLIDIYTRKGLRVGAIKHDAHDFIVSPRLTDTGRFREAGAVSIAIANNDGHFALERMCAESPPLGHLIAELGEVDVVIVEGYKMAALPKWVVLGGVVPSGDSYEEPDFLHSPDVSKTVLGFVVPDRAISVAANHSQVYHRDDLRSICDATSKALNQDLLRYSARSDIEDKEESWLGGEV